MSDTPKYALATLFGSISEQIVHHTPHAHRLGMRVVEMGPATATLKLPYRPELVGDPQRGVVFGGVITTLLDHTSGLAVACAMEELTAIATVDLRVDYLRAAEPGMDLYARVDCYKMARSVAFIRGIAWEHDPADPFASCQATFMIGSSSAGSPFTEELREEEERRRK